MAIDVKTIENSREYLALEKTLGKLRSDAIKLLSESKDETHARRRATAINKKLTDSLKFSNLAGRSKCPPGTTYDPVTQTCV